MRRVDLSHVPIDRLNSKSFAAFEVLQSREDVAAEFTGAFACLLKFHARARDLQLEDSSSGIPKPSKNKATSTSGSRGARARYHS